MVARTRQIGADLARGPVEVSPTAHFHMGGVVIDPDCQTSIAGCLVAGEDAGGTHGANRLGGNGVAESTVFGARSGDTAARVARSRSLREPNPRQIAKSISRAMAPLGRDAGPWPFALTAELKDLMWRNCGVVRDGAGLREARAGIEQLEEKLTSVAVPGPPRANFAWQEALDLENQMTVARLVIESALVREESRGAHYRSDFPERDDNAWLRYIVLRRAGEGFDVDVRPVEFARTPAPTQVVVNP